MAEPKRVMHVRKLREVVVNRITELTFKRFSNVVVVCRNSVCHSELDRSFPAIPRGSSLRLALAKARNCSTVRSVTPKSRPSTGSLYDEHTTGTLSRVTCTTACMYSPERDENTTFETPDGTEEDAEALARTVGDAVAAELAVALTDRDGA